MTDAEIRLHIMTLCHRHDRPAQEIVARASELESYVLSSRQPGEKSPKGRAAKAAEADKAQAPA